MLYATLTALGILLALSLAVSRDPLFPPAVFAGTWLASLLGVAVLGDSMYPISLEGYTVYLLGTVAFTVGGIAAARLPRPPPAPAAPGTSRAWIHRCLDAVLVVLVVGLPAYWTAIVGAEGDLLSLQAVRALQVERVEEASTFQLALNLNVLAQYAALALVFESDGSRPRRLRAIGGFVLAVVYGALSGAKFPVIALVLSAFFVHALRGGRIGWRSAGAAALGSVALFSLGLLAVNFAGEEFTDAGELARALVRMSMIYVLGGVFAFGAVAETPDAYVTNQPTLRFFLETGRSLGLPVEVPPLHAEYTWIAPYTETNVYSAYFTYFKDLGWAGTGIVLTALGFGLTLLYRAALTRRPVPVILSGRMAVGLVLSIHAEHVFLELNGLIKLALFLFVLYEVVPALEARRKVAPGHA